MEDNKFKLVKTIATIIGIFAIIFLTIIEFTKEESNFLTYFLWVAGFLIFWLIFFFGTDIFRKLKKAEDKLSDREKLPEVFSEAELRKIIKARIESFDYWNHIKRWGRVTPYTIGRNLIYDFEIEFLHEDKKLGKGCYFIVNAHYPKDRFAILRENPPSSLRARIANSLSIDPKDDPEIEETESKNELLGTVTKTKKTRPKNKFSQDKNEKKEDLA